MNLIDNIKAINGGGIFEAYSEDALLLGGRVLKNEQDVGLTDRKVNYFYTRFDDRPLKIQKAEIQIKSCTPYEIASPKVLVLQFKEFDLNGIMYAALNVFNANYNRLRYEVNEVDIRKEIILKQEVGEVKPMEGYSLVKISYTEYMPLDGCEDITCNGDVVIPITNDVKVYINSVLRYEPTCGTDLELTLVDQDGLSIDATYNGTEIVVNTAGADARVSNSDDSYDVNVASGGDLELPDEAITVNSAAFITKPSVKDQDILLKDVSGNVITPEALSGNAITILDAVNIKGLMPTQTGQTTSYATNDDGDLQRGRLTNFDTIPYNNPFGATDRFTDSVGTQVYADGVVVDWSTWDGGSSVLGYSTSNNSSTSGKQVWANWMSNSPYSVGAFSNFYVANSNELLRMMKSGTLFLNYTPFSANNPAGFWIAFSCTTTEVSSTARAISGQSNIDYPQRSTKTTSGYALLVRDFTISGTTLS